MMRVLVGMVLPLDEKGEEAGKRWRERGQDRKRTPFYRKAEAFHAVHAGASVGERAARKEKASKFKARNGTTGHFRRKAARP
jgi:hypothetical protein